MNTNSTMMNPHPASITKRGADVSLRIVLLLLSAGLCVLVGWGCSGKPDANTELAKAAAAMAEPAPAPPAVAPAAAPAPSSAPTTQPPAETPAPATAMNQAMAAYKSGNLEDAVTRLQKLRATPVLSPQQRIAINDAMAAVMGEI